MYDHDTCPLLSEEMIQAMLSRLDVYELVRSACLADSVQHGPALSVQMSGHDIGVKTGAVSDMGFGIKVRAGAEGSYVSLVWDRARRLHGLVESAFLTYCRTAAAMLLPVTQLSPSVGRVLVMGSGRLGQTCALLARDLHPNARIHIWSRQARQLNSECTAAIDSWWTPDQSYERSFDLIVTCTRSPVPLPLEDVESAFVSVGGAVDGHRRELPDNLREQVQVVYADAPEQVPQRCRDVDGLVTSLAIRPLSALASDRLAPAVQCRGRTLTFVCGAGGYDAMLAGRVLSLVVESAESMKAPATSAPSGSLSSRKRGTTMNNIAAQTKRWWDEDSTTYDDVAQHYPTRQVEWAAWAASVCRLLPPAPARVLDVGAGTGFLSIICAHLGHKVTAADLSPGMLRQLRHKAEDENLAIEVVECSADSIPNTGFDVIIERHLLWTLPDPTATLRTWRKAAPDAKLVLFESLWGGALDPMDRLLVPARNWLRRLRGVRPHHHAEYPTGVRRSLPLGGGTPPAKLIDMLLESGWENPRLERLSDVEWASRIDVGLLEYLMGVPPRFVISAS